MMLLRPILAFAAVLLLNASALAERIAPAPPADYDVQVRYRIRAGSQQRIEQFRAMVKYLESIGFKRIVSEDPNEPADTNAERLYGSLPSSRVAELLKEPHIREVLLTPAGYRLPEDPEKRVLVQLKLVETLSTNRQRELYFQSLAKLAQIGFVEKVGYDHERFTRILGTMPSGDVPILLGDLRAQPAGWFVSDTPIENLPDPIQQISPIRIVEVLAEPAGVAESVDVPPPPAPPAGQEFLAKIAPDLRRAAAAEAAEAPIRMEVVLTNVPAQNDNSWRNILSSQSNLVIEGRLGPVVSIVAPATAARALAALPEVATVRPPRSANLQSARLPAATGGDLGSAALAASGLQRLHNLKFRGAGIRVAVIDTDFAGAQGKLPTNTPVIDLTATRNYTILPDAVPEGSEQGRGTRLALAAKLAAPEAELVLVRVDPAAMYQLYVVSRYIHGDATRSDALASRFRELSSDGDQLRHQRNLLTEERKALQAVFDQDEQYVQKRKSLDERTAALAVEERKLLERLNRFYAIETALVDLRKVNIVVCPLSWDEGYPVDGSGPLSRYLDDTFYGRPRPKMIGQLSAPKSTALWFQSTGNTRGQAWGGPLIDTDRTGVFHFAPAGAKLPEGRWSRDLNFLAWQPTNGERSFDLPAGGRIRIVLQWTEAHDPTLSNQPGPDPYRRPLANLQLLVLRQRDPSGKNVGSDDFNVVARTDTLPQLIERRPNWATYEYLLEFAAESEGRFALRLEGTVPPFIRPPSVASVPAIEKTWESHARIFVSTVGQSSPGRVVIGDFQSGLGSLGAPGNALLPRTVGAANSQGERQPYSAGGPPAGQALLVKPTFLTFDELPIPGTSASVGTELATAFAAGMYASMMSAGTIESQKLLWLGVPPSGMLHVPPLWLDQIERRWPKTGRE